ncbi:MAG: type III-B CRISPR module RAMP protein Cmr6 [Chloroflexaceae bacterium]|nr:type III-B CRISPR module RAMP protein Cmr6 [Chloroflexaceae bacterium]
MQTRRDKLCKVQPGSTTHAGLWLDAYLPDKDKRDEPLGDEAKKHQLVRDVANCEVPDVYTLFFERWQGQLAAVGARCRKATVGGRLAIGLGAEAVLETSLTLHRTYGVPYIPGSALKGLAASYARRGLQGTEWTDKEAAYRLVFGDTKSAGYITFYDALYIPCTGKPDAKQPLQPDVLTVHHRDYYAGKGEPPADWDSPVPVPFLSATGQYLLALAPAPAVGDRIDEWIDAVFVLLTNALSEWGIGAKTSSGYGRMEVEAPPLDTEKAQVGDQTEPALPGSALSLEEQRIQAEVYLQQWRGDKVIVQLAEMVEGGCMVKPKPGQQMDYTAFIPEEQFAGRLPKVGNDMACRIVGLMEHTGAWVLVLEWLEKKGKKERQR